MATKRFRLVVAETAIQPFGVLYIGDDSAKADEAFNTAVADETVLSVRLFIYPLAVKTRYPSVELHQANADSGVALRGAQARLESATTLFKKAGEAGAAAAKRKDIAAAALKVARQQHDAGQLHAVLLNAKIKDHHEADLALRSATEQFNLARAAHEKATAELRSIQGNATEATEVAQASAPENLPPPAVEPAKVIVTSSREAPDPTETAKSPDSSDEAPPPPSADYVDPAQGAPTEAPAESAAPTEKPRHRTRRSA